MLSQNSEQLVANKQSLLHILSELLILRTYSFASFIRRNNTHCENYFFMLRLEIIISYPDLTLKNLILAIKAV